MENTQNVCKVDSVQHNKHAMCWEGFSYFSVWSKLLLESPGSKWEHLSPYREGSFQLLCECLYIKWNTTTVMNTKVSASSAISVDLAV